MRVATWNLEWAKPGTNRHRRALEHLVFVDADVVVTTEESVHDWASYPHRIDGGVDWGYRIVEGRRKVIAWSKEPWIDVRVADTGPMRGRFVRGRTTGSDSPVTVVAVCIPWKDSHVRSGRQDQQPWEHHRAFCEQLEAEISQASSEGRVVVAGDFNQRIPRVNQPMVVAEALALALGDLEVVTAGPQEAGLMIDHIAISPDLVVERAHSWPNVIDGQRISDHGGVAVDIS